MRTLGSFWRDDVETARRESRRCRRYMEVRYERLIVETEATLRQICAFLDLPFSRAMLDYHARAARRMHELSGGQLPDRPFTREQRLAQHPFLSSPPRADRIARWRKEMSPDERREFESVAGELLAELGYESALAFQ